MPVEVDQLAVQHAGDLVDAIGHQEGPVENRDLGLALGQILAIHIDGAGHGRFLCSYSGNWRTAPLAALVVSMA